MTYVHACVYADSCVLQLAARSPLFHSTRFLRSFVAGGSVVAGDSLDSGLC